MNCRTALIGVIFGVIMAKKPDIHFFHAISAFLLIFAMMYFENWASIKLKEKREIHGIFRGLILFTSALVAASLYIKISSMDFFMVAYGSAIYAILLYFMTRYKEEF